MLNNTLIGVVIPALNEESSIALVVGDIPSFVDVIIVVDNGSTDTTKQVAEDAGAIVLEQPIRGYGHACSVGINYLRERHFEIVVFLDGDYSDYPEELSSVVDPIINDDYDFILGSRVLGERESGALLPQALFGNQLAGFLVKLFWGYVYTDLGPFRAIRLAKLDQMKMREMRYGWTVEMQIKAAKMKLRCKEVPVRYRKRIGQSKVTGTLSGTVKASYRILHTIFRHLISSK
jgi:glycosyltransferase involved in cell wall biosynthesis